MALAVASLSELDPTQVANLQASFSQLLQEQFPDVELTRGVIHDLVAFLGGGVSGAVNQTEVNRVLASNSLLAVQNNPQLADPALVDALLSNLLITRNTGTNSTGEITIVVNSNSTVVISTGTVFTANGVSFAVNSSILAKPQDNSTLGPTDRFLNPLGDGTFDFTVPVTATTPGAAGNISNNTVLTTSNPPVTMVTAYAASDFTGGTDVEDNATLMSRIATGIPAKVCQGRDNITALIKSNPQLSGTLNMSIVGFSNPEMTRDQHGLFPVSGGGRIDIYTRTGALPITTTVTKTCTLVSIQNGQSTWQFSVNRDDAPGFYFVNQVRRPTDPADFTGFQVVSDVRGTDFSTDVYIPDVIGTFESNYTRYQNAVIQFVDTLSDLTGLTVGSTAQYVISLYGLPLIDATQDFINQPNQINLMADVLVKAAIPCFLSINFNIAKNNNESSPNTAVIAANIANMINNLDFPGMLYASQIDNVIYQSLTGSMAVEAITMKGMIRRVDGNTVMITDQHVLNIPNSPSTLVTPNTTTFFLDPMNVGIAVYNRNR